MLAPACWRSDVVRAPGAALSSTRTVGVLQPCGPTTLQERQCQPIGLFKHREDGQTVEGASAGIIASAMLACTHAGGEP